MDLPEPEERRRKTRLFWLKLVISVSLFGWIVGTTDIAPVLRSLSDVRLPWLFAAASLQIVGTAIVAARWRVLLKAERVEPGYLYLFRSTLSSMFFRQFLPSVIGGDALRAHDAWRAGARMSFALISLFVDRLLGLFALALFAAIALLALGSGAEDFAVVAWPLSGGLAILVALLAALFMGGTAGKKTAWLDTLVPVVLRARARAVLEPLGAFKGHSGLFWRAGFLALLLQVNNVTFYWMLSEALSLDVDFATFFIIAPLAIFIMTLPISINGIGLRETAFVLLLGMTGVAGEQALALAWMEFGLILMLGGVGGLVYITRPERPMPPRTA